MSTQPEPKSEATLAFEREHDTKRAQLEDWFQRTGTLIWKHELAITMLRFKLSKRAIQSTKVMIITEDERERVQEAMTEYLPARADFTK